MDEQDYTPPLTRRHFIRKTGVIFAASALVGQQAAQTLSMPSPEVLEAYSAWLHNERHALVREIYASADAETVRRMAKLVPCGTLADAFHWPVDGSLPTSASARAMTVLTATGVLHS